VANAIGPVSRETFSSEPTQPRRAYLAFGRCLAFCFALACGFGFTVAFLATGFLVVAFLLTIIISFSTKKFDHLQ
jgi:uncharacterized membrane protein YgaE (UPF0421/DUF939 family)